MGALLRTYNKRLKEYITKQSVCQVKFCRKNDNISARKVLRFIGVGVYNIKCMYIC